MSDIKLEEKNGDLIVHTPKLTLTVEPVSAKLGAKMLANFLNISLYGGVGLTEEEAGELYKLSMGEANLELAENTLRRQIYLEATNAVVWWQVSGLAEAEAFLGEGMKAALEIHFGRSGLSLSEILQLTESVTPTQKPDDTPATTTPTGSKSGSKTGANQQTKPKRAGSAGKPSSNTGKRSNATSTNTTQSTGPTTTS